MKKINLSVILNVLVLVFLVSTFFKYEFLFITRSILIIFTFICLLIEVKKDYFSRNKAIYIIFSIVSIIAIIASILIDNSSEGNITGNKDYLIPIFVFIYIATMYKDLYGNNK